LVVGTGRLVDASAAVWLDADIGPSHPTAITDPVATIRLIYLAPCLGSIAGCREAILSPSTATVGPFFFVVQQQTAAIVQRLGRFESIAESGLHFKIPFVQKVPGTVNVRLQQLNVAVETKTLDNVFVRVMVSVQYNVLPEKVYDGFYRLDDPVNQIKAFVFDVVRARVPKMKLDDVFEKKDEAKALSGKGIADQRRAIVDGLRESVDDLQRTVEGTSATDVMNLILMTRYFDTLKDLGASVMTTNAAAK